MLRNSKPCLTKLFAVSLVGLMLLNACGGGGEDTTNSGRTNDPVRPPNRVTLSLSDLTQDTSQGKTIIVDYQGPAFDEDDLTLSVGDTLVQSTFLDGQIYLILPLTQLGETALAFDFGGFSSSLSVDITAAPAIVDPPAYVSGVVEDLAAELDALPAGDWQDEIDALYAAQQELSNLSANEIRELAVVLKQNVEPLLRQLNSPVVAQFSAAACEAEMQEFVLAGGLVHALKGAFVVAAGAVVALYAPPTFLVAATALSVSVAAVVVGAEAILQATEDILDACLVTAVVELEAGLANILAAPAPAGVRVAQDDPETIGRIHFEEGQAQAIILSLNRTFDPEWQPEFVGTMQDVGNLLSKLNTGLRSAVGILPGFFPFSSVARGMNAFIGKLDGFISTFAGLENPGRVERANHADFRLEGIAHPNITGSITAATSEGLSLSFSFRDPSRVPPEGHVDFEFALSNARAGLEAFDVPARLVAGEVIEVTIESLAITCTYLRTEFDTIGRVRRSSTACQ